MPDAKMPYVTASGNVTKVFEKIQPAATPQRFTQDFLSTKLGMSGGGARPVIPFLKRTGFLASDGSPTERYRRFRSSATRGRAAAEGLLDGYKPLYEMNEDAHNLNDKGLKDLVIQATGAEKGSSTVTAIVGSFRALLAFADFSQSQDDNGDAEESDRTEDREEAPRDMDAFALPSGLNVGYTINLHLPATSDVAVFNAIFKALRENLLR